MTPCHRPASALTERTTVGDFLPEFDGLGEAAKRVLWAKASGDCPAGAIGRVRRLARIVPRDEAPLPFRIPFVFRMDGQGVYFGSDVEGLWRIFGGKSPVTRVLWGRLLMRGEPRIQVADVALGRTSLMRDVRGWTLFLHHFAAWARIPVITPARAYFAWRRRRLRLDSYEVLGVKLFPFHGHYTIVGDRRRILWRGRHESLASFREAERAGRL